MNKLTLANAALSLLLLTSCNQEGNSVMKSSEKINKNLTIVSSPSIISSVSKEMNMIQPVKAEVKKEFKPIVKKVIHKEIKTNKPVVKKSNITIKKENNKTKINNKPISKKYIKEMTVEATAYTIFEGNKSPSHPDFAVTASGIRAKVNVTAAMDKSIPYGTVIQLEDGTKRIIQDRGGRIKQGKLDVLVTSRSEARKFGRKKHYKIRVISWGNNKTHFKK